MISSAETSLDSFYLTDDDLLNSPSLKDGIDQETEFWLRFYGCDLIVEACIYLRLCVQTSISQTSGCSTALVCATAFAQCAMS